MEEVGGLEAGEGGADDDLAGLVDDEAGGAAGALALEAGAGGAVGGDVDRAGVDARILASASVLPAAATWGSVKVTRGDPIPSATASTGRPRTFSAATQAWYLPMWVKSARPLTSPTA